MYKKKKIGLVISNKMKKTIVMAETYKKKHPIYKKFILKTKKYHVHDEHNLCKKGDLVKIIETRPFSKTKRWRLLKIIKCYNKNQELE